MTNKLAMSKKLQESGIPTARYRQLHKPDDIAVTAMELGCPLVVKPSLGTGRRKIQIVPSIDHYNELCKQNLLHSVGQDVPWLAEEFIQKEEYLCDALLQEGNLSFVSVSRYFKPLLQVKDEVEGAYTLSSVTFAYHRIDEGSNSLLSSRGWSSSHESICN